MAKPEHLRIKIGTVQEEQEHFVLRQEDFTDERWSRIIDPHDKRKLEYFRAIREKNESYMVDRHIDFNVIDIIGLVNDFGSVAAVGGYLGLSVKKIWGHYKRAIGDNGPINRF